MVGVFIPTLEGNVAEQARVFVGIELNLTTCEKLVLVQEDLHTLLRDRGASVRWTPPQNLHLTVKFIGDIDRSLLPRLRNQLDAVAVTSKPFSIGMLGVGAFPDGQTPRILFARVNSGTEKLDAFVDRVEESMSELGLARETRPYTPHVTVGRVKTPKDRIDMGDVVEALQDLPLGATKVADVVLYESHLTPRGAQYQVLSRHRLSGRG